ncbi:PGAM-domain-containing protein [Mollisia scopiformis]|uniref:PGAM-domain-containing protein n=1 Tax=Mollisia scopiformis TaxID=149040 RepID=A0A194XCR2_MOLSC|nr:PGAM-domain-containing protein [Mollisia scopiformis]KUJ17960.1 PGAM-domain-containing protein [Mollisia scopiformis]
MQRHVGPAIHVPICANSSRHLTSATGCFLNHFCTSKNPSYTETNPEEIPSLPLSVPMATIPRPEFVIHLVRHAEAVHKLLNQDADYSIRNPKLTRNGQIYCIEQRSEMEPIIRRVQHILCSPLRRTIETALLLFEASIEKGIKLELREELQSFGQHPSSLGDSIAKLKETFGEIAITDGLLEDYNDVRIKESVDSDSEDGRWDDLVERVQELYEQYEGKHVEIAIVTHSSVIHSTLALDCPKLHGGILSYCWDGLKLIKREQLERLREIYGQPGELRGIKAVNLKDNQWSKEREGWLGKK